MKRSRVRRLIAMVMLGLLLVGGVLAYRKYWLARPVGSGPAGPAVAAEPFEQPWTDRKVLLLGAGDSITAGFGVDQAHSLLGRLADNPPDEFPDMRGKCLRRVLPHLETRNIAVSGSTSLEHLQIIRRELEQQPEDVLGLVVLTTGGNDLIHDYGRAPPREGALYGATLEQARPWIESFETRLGEILDLIASRFPGGRHIFLADIYDPTDGVGDAPAAGLPDWPDGLAIHAAYNRAIHRAGSERAGVYIVPLHHTFLGHGVHCAQPWREHYCREDPAYWYGFNLEDPNIRGYDAARRAFLIEMAAASADWK